MDYIRLTEDNIDGEHICCAMSGKQSLRRMAQAAVCGGLVFTGAGSGARRCFIEDISADTHGFPFGRRMPLH